MIVFRLMCKHVVKEVCKVLLWSYLSLVFSWTEHPLPSFVLRKKEKLKEVCNYETKICCETYQRKKKFVVPNFNQKLLF